MPRLPNIPSYYHKHLVQRSLIKCHHSALKCEREGAAVLLEFTRHAAARLQVPYLLVQELSGIFFNVSLVQVGGEAH